MFANCAPMIAAEIETAMTVTPSDQSEPHCQSSAECVHAERLAVVIIGRNEGDRLDECITSAIRETSAIVYVDSGSTDDSLAIARKYGAMIVELDTSDGFSAAKARNAGASKLVEADVDCDFVQFVDGDCVLNPTWVDRGVAYLESNPEYAIVCGRRREKSPDVSIYNALCDREWDTPIGEALSCGGDSICRSDAFTEVGGFAETVIAGEEPELCVRLRQAGWKIRRLDAEMTLHDASMHHFSQWWSRARRAGFAYAQGATLHGRGPQRHWVREVCRAWIWAFIIPTVALLAVACFGAIGLLPLLAYPLLWTKAFWAERQRAEPWKLSAAWATSCVVCKFPELLGQLQFVASKIRRKPFRPIEYKTGGE